MNILFLSPVRDTWGRAETWMTRLASGLQLRGDSCAILADARSPWPGVCRDEKLEWIPCPVSRPIPVAWPRLHSIFRDRKPDAVIVHGFQTARLARAAGPGVALLLKLSASADLTESLADRLTFRYGVDRVLVDSYAVRDHYRRYPWVPPGKIVAVHTGIPVSGEFPDPGRRRIARNRLGLSDSILAVGVAANLIARSRVMDALEAFARAGLGEQARLIILGEGPMRAELERRSASRGLSAPVLFTGWREDASELMWGLDLYLHTSHEEGLPRAMLEAMSCGGCAIAGRSGGASEVLRDGVDGFLVPPGDLERYAERLRETAADSDLRARMGRAAAQRIREEFTLEAMVRRAHDALAEIIERRQLLRRRHAPVSGSDGWNWIRAPGFDPDEVCPSGVEVHRRLLREETAVPGWARWRPVRAVRLFRRAQRLALLDTAAVPHLAAGWRKTGAGRRESLLITSRESKWIRASDWLLAHNRDHAARRLFLTELAIWLGRRHAAGVVPRGLTADTLLIREADGDWKFILADVESCVLRWKPTLRTLADQWVEFMHSIEPYVSRADLLRFAAEYRDVRHLHRATLRRLIQKMDQEKR
ncbi:MAG: glycosyltransferase [Kiritimatiellia bacterium]|nr:glycosyltransferase [Kiritimatiellia bacterium]